jgi:hypothetical protein
MFTALCKRRNIWFKYERFANALTAAAVYNTNRTSSDSPTISAFDFIRSAEDSAQKDELQRIKSAIRQSIGIHPVGTPRKKFLEIRQRTIDLLKSQGRQDAEELFNQVWSSLKPNKEEETCQP